MTRLSCNSSYGHPIRSDILLSSSGANRTRTRWDLIRELSAPYPDQATVASLIDAARRAADARREAERLLEQSRENLHEQLQLDSATANMVLMAFKPPK